jgi:UTP--glucose-1-phosphate uridylyltransferase
MEKLRQRMRQGGCSERQIDRFIRRVEAFLAHQGGLISEQEIRPVESLATLDQLPARPELLRQAVILKLNGGLGTSMGLTGPKGLLEVKDGDDFYSILLRQLEAFEQRDGFRPPLVFMNSFSTEELTTARLRELGFQQELPWSFLQSQVPKIDEQGQPAEVEDRYAWCPPGHGDLYASLLDSGLRDQLLEQGYRYLFVSNIDNLGAVLDSRPLAYMEQRGVPFLMEVTRRGEEDRKGGHLARAASGGLLLREVAQCPDEDMGHFQDISRHRFFNTNNLWVRLDAIDESWTDLPLIVNRKPVIPHDEQSPRVIQLESAMGAAIGTVAGAGAVEVGRDRFFPVKTTNDLFALRSDLYRLNEARVLEATVERPTLVDLDPKHYKMMDGFDALVKGAPSLKECRRLTVRGPVIFTAEDKLSGEVSLSNPAGEPRRVGELP